MNMYIQSKRMKVSIGGVTHTIYVGNDITEERMSRVLLVTRAYLQQYVYVEMVLAETFMMIIEESVQKKKCFRFKAKSYWKGCKENLRKSIKEYDSYCVNSDFNNDFAMTYYDNIKDDMYKLRDKIADRLQKFGANGNAGLYANAILLYNFLSMCISTYDAIMIRLNERLGLDLSRAFVSFLPFKAFDQSYMFLCEVMGKDYERLANHVGNKEINAYFDKVRNMVFDSKLQDKAAVCATEDVDEECQKLQRKSYDLDEVLAGNFPKSEEVYHKAI